MPVEQQTENGKGGEYVHPRLILFVLGLSGFTFSLAQTLLAPALTTLQQEFNTDANGVAWTITVYFLAAAVFTPIFGRLGDMFGKRRMLLVSMSLFAVANVISALATTMTVLLIGRTLLGAGGGIFPLCFGLARDALPPDRVRAAIGQISATAGLGAGFGLIGGALIAEYMSFHWIFWWSAILAFACALGTLRYVPESAVRTLGRVDVPGALILAAGLVPLLLAISKANAWGWTAPRTLLLAGLGIAVLAIWFMFESRRDDPLMDVHSLRQRNVLIPNLATLTVGFGIFAGFPLLLLLIESPLAGLHLSTTTAALAMLPAALAMLLAGSASARIAARFGNPAPLVLGGAVSAAGFLLTALFHDSLLPIMVWSALIACGITLSFAAMTNLIVVAVPSTQTGSAVSFNTVTRATGSALGSQVIASVLAASAIGGVATSEGFTNSFYVAAAVALGGAVLAMLIRGSPRRSEALSEALEAPHVAAAKALP